MLKNHKYMEYHKKNALSFAYVLLNVYKNVMN